MRIHGEKYTTSPMERKSVENFTRTQSLSGKICGYYGPIIANLLSVTSFVLLLFAVNSFISKQALKLARKFNSRMIFGLLLDRSSYLHVSGWLRSVRQMQAVDTSNSAIPWLSYPFIEFIGPRLTKDMHVYEFGSGNSTRWFANQVGFIKSIEHTPDWYNLLKDKLPDNALLVHEPIDSTLSYHSMAFMSIDDATTYSTEIKRSGESYDLIIVDGVNRNNCIVNAIDCAKKNGVIIVDNLEYSHEMQDGLNLLSEKGYRRLEFWGLSPIVYTKTCTALFYRPDNCLLI